MTEVKFLKHHVTGYILSENLNLSIKDLPYYFMKKRERSDMNVIIPGSDGCVSTPRACCSCRVYTEDWGKSYDDYKELDRIHFAYDGLKNPVISHIRAGLPSP